LSNIEVDSRVLNIVYDKDILRIVPPKPNYRYHILKLVLDQQIYRFGQNPEKTIYHNKNEGLIITTMLEIAVTHEFK